MVVPVGAVGEGDHHLHRRDPRLRVPAFWIKIDAVPGRLNETWFKVEQPGVYYGQCYELCGARHGYMPIAVEVVSRERSSPQWVASKGGTYAGRRGRRGRRPRRRPPPRRPAPPPARHRRNAVAGDGDAGHHEPAARPD